MATLWTRIFLLGSTLGVAVSLILVSLTVWLEKQPLPELSSIDIRLQYQRQLLPLEQNINVIVADDTMAVEQTEVSALRQRLMYLTVPPEAKDFHLSLVLKLQQLEDLLNQRAIGKKVSLENIQAEIKELVVKHQW